MDKLTLVAFVLTYAMGVSVSAQIIELPIQDQVPKSLPILDTCPDTPYPMIIISSNYYPQFLWSNQYIVCLRGIPLIFNCSDGLFFNYETLTCDFPYERKLSLISTEQEIPDLSQYPVPITPDKTRISGPLTDESIPPQNPIPMNPYMKSLNGPVVVPITRPDPEVIEPLPVLPPARPLPFPIPVRPIPYRGNYYYKY